MRMIDVEDLLKRLKENHPDKMLLDDGDGFTRGKCAGHIELILEIESIIEEDKEDG